MSIHLCLPGCYADSRSLLQLSKAESWDWLFNDYVQYCFAVLILTTTLGNLEGLDGFRVTAQTATSLA